jgi:hypothetical protein
MREDKIETRKIDEEQFSKSGLKDVTQSESDQLFSYYNLIKESLNGLAYARSKSPINGAIVGAFSKYYHNLPRNQKLSIFAGMWQGYHNCHHHYNKCDSKSFLF